MESTTKIAFTPGVKVIVESPSLFNQKFTSYFRGYKTGQWVIIDQPLHNDRPIPLDVEIEVMVRFIIEGKAFGFKSEIMGLAKRPFPLVFLAYPENVESSNLRRDERYPVRLDAAFSLESQDGDSNEKTTGQILNLSLNGCLLTSTEPYDTETFLYLSIPFPEQGLVKNLETEVKACRKQDSEFHMGLNFVDKLDPQHKKIESYLENLKALQVRV